jgi:hypothetical protein
VGVWGATGSTCCGARAAAHADHGNELLVAADLGAETLSGTAFVRAAGVSAVAATVDFRKTGVVQDFAFGPDIADLTPAELHVRAFVL